MTTPIDYTSRDYWSLRQDMIDAVRARVPDWAGENSSDLILVILEAVAFMGDILSYYTDRVANEAFLPTAQGRQSLLNIAETYGYSPAGPSRAAVAVRFAQEFDSGAGEATIPAGTVLRGTYSLNGTDTEVAFETIEDVTITADTEDLATGIWSGEAFCTAVEGETQKEFGLQGNGSPIGILLGVSDGSPNQEFLIDDLPVSATSVRVWVHETRTNGREYYPVAYLVDGSQTSRIFRTRYYADGRISVQFGDGASGAIPPIGTEIRCVYVRGGGAKGNIPAGTLDLIDTDLPVLAAVTNVSAGSGGAEAESNDVIRANAAAALRAHRRIVRLSDAEDLAKVVSGVAHAKAVGSAMSNVGVYIVPNYADGDLTPGFIAGVESSTFTDLKVSVRDALADSMPYGSTVSVHSPQYVPVTVEVTVRVPDGVRKSEAKDAVTTALKSLYALGSHDLGAEMYPAEIYATLSALDVVKSAQVTNFSRTASATTAVLDPIYGAPSEMFHLDSASLAITLLGGINDLT